LFCSIVPEARQYVWPLELAPWHSWTRRFCSISRNRKRRPELYSSSALPRPREPAEITRRILDGAPLLLISVVWPRAARAGLPKFRRADLFRKPRRNSAKSRCGRKLRPHTKKDLQGYWRTQRNLIHSALGRHQNYLANLFGFRGRARNPRFSAA